MSKENEITSKLNKVMIKSLLELETLVTSDLSQRHDFSSVVNTFLLGVISTAVDLVEVKAPGSSHLMYADIEAAAKLGGLRAIKDWQAAHGMTYSVSGIDPEDTTTAMNYLGKELSSALFKGLHELPPALRNQETLLRGIEALLANLLNQKFEDPHQILDSLCEHVHMVLADLETHSTH